MRVGLASRQYYRGRRIPTTSTKWDRMKPAAFANLVGAETSGYIPTRDNGKTLAKLFDLRDPARSELLNGIPDGDKGPLSVRSTS